MYAAALWAGSRWRWDSSPLVSHTYDERASACTCGFHVDRITDSSYNLTSSRQMENTPVPRAKGMVWTMRPSFQGHGANADLVREPFMPKFSAPSKHNLVNPIVLASSEPGLSLSANNTVYRYTCTGNNDASAIQGKINRISWMLINNLGKKKPREFNLQAYITLIII